MRTKLFQKCCRLCLDDTKQQVDVLTVENLADTIQQLYSVKIDKNDACSKKICVDCCQEAKESQKWLKFHEEQKKFVAENQRIFAEEVLNQLGPESISPAISLKSNKSGRSDRRSSSLRNKHDNDDDEEEEILPSKGSSRRTRNSTRRMVDEDEEEEEALRSKATPRTTRIKRESGRLRTSNVKKEWLPSDAERGESSTPTTEGGASNGDDEEEASEPGTSTTDEDLKCPKCEKVFSDIDSLERHNCEFICSICGAGVKYRNSLKRHLITVHKIAESHWHDYWNPGSTWDEAQELLVETARPKKRYRYESDSPTDMEENTDSEEDNSGREISCNYCGEKFDTNDQLKAHECEYGCDICGYKFASRTNVKRHKINVHKLDPNDPSLLPRTPSRPPSRGASSRPPSRAASRAGSEHGSDDQPLATLASSKTTVGNNGQEQVELTITATVGEDRYEVVLPQSMIKYRYYCPHCDYSSYERYKIKRHMMGKHKIPANQIDMDADIRREPSPERSKSPGRTKPQSRATTPVPEIELPIPEEPEPSLTIDIAPSQPEVPNVTAPIQPIVSSFVAHQHRSRSRSIHESVNNHKRKRSNSSSSSKASRFVRSRSNPPPDRQILVAKRRLSPVRPTTPTAPSKRDDIPAKLRPTVTAIESNRLAVTIQNGCALNTTGSSIRLRASSHIVHDNCPTKKLFKLRAPVGHERQQVQLLRKTFSALSHQISAHSRLTAIDVDSLVLDPSATAVAVDSSPAAPPSVPVEDPLGGVSTVAEKENQTVGASEEQSTEKSKEETTTSTENVAVESENLATEESTTEDHTEQTEANVEVMEIDDSAEKEQEDEDANLSILPD